jgi:hypothetical protein
MRALGVVVADLLVENPPSVRLTEHDHMVEAFAPDRPDDAFRVRVLERQVVRAHDTSSTNCC